jgi:hypothetical protein
MIFLLVVALAALGFGIYLYLNKSGESSSGRKIVFSKRIEIPAQEMWVDTGLDVTDKNLQIKYESGQWSNDAGDGKLTDGEGFIPNAQDFRDLIPKLIVPNTPLGSLVGKTDSGPFFVGNVYEGNPGQGRLYLSINEKPDSFADNTGSIQVIVSFIE